MKVHRKKENIFSKTDLPKNQKKEKVRSGS